MNASISRCRPPIRATALALALSLALLGTGLWDTHAAQPTGATLHPIDVRLASASTGTDGGSLAVRIHAPAAGNARYPDGAPVLIWVLGGFEVKGIDHGLPPEADDVICITFIYPGGEDSYSGLASDGTYDYRGENCIAALRDVLLYAAGELTDARGRTIDDVVGVPVLHDNIGMIGESNGGNILTAVAAQHGANLAGRLRYLIQWETPVSSQIATRDLGRVWLKPTTAQGDYWNPRYECYGPLVLSVDTTDLAYDPAQDVYPLFHDGNGDGRYTTVTDARGISIPDLDRNGVLTNDEDFPLDTYPVDDGRVTYSRPVMRALAARTDESLDGLWPDRLVSLAESEAYWDLRESVRLTDEAIANIPDLEAMILCCARDHVQAMPEKPHVRQAFDSWANVGAWVKINPSPESLLAVDSSLSGRPLPDLSANTTPTDWTDHASYAMPVDVPKPVYELAAIYEMADRVHDKSDSSTTAAPDEVMTFVSSDGIGRIAVAVRVPETARFVEGAPIIVNVSGFFTSSSGFKYELDPDALEAIYVTYLWPGKTDARTGITSDGTYDYGGPDCLTALRDVIRFATGEIADVEGRSLSDLVGIPVLYEVTGLYAFSHSGIAATNALALHGADLQAIDFFVGRENPTLDALYPLEPGHWDDETGRPLFNPFYDPAGYTPTSIAIDYSTVYWLQNADYPEGRPAFRTEAGGLADYVCSFKHPQMWEKDYWSTDLLQALLDNGALTRETWPRNLALPEEAAERWSFRETVHNYPLLADELPELRVMLVFAADDHVQVAIDKPHIHHAYDGFHDAAGLWCRLNPDRAYVDAFLGESRRGTAIPDNPANREPATWMAIRSWGYAQPSGANTNVLVPLAAVAEMLDRAYYDVWEDNLNAVLGDP